MARVYVVEDNELIRSAVADCFMLNDHEVIQFDKAAGVMGSLEIAHPDAIILDILLPDGNGYRIDREVRTTTKWENASLKKERPNMDLMDRRSRPRSGYRAPPPCVAQYAVSQPALPKR